MQAEWDILRGYTRRIRSLTTDRVNKESIKILSNPPTTESLFPNLRCLRCAYADGIVPLLHLPLPSLISLDLNFMSVPVIQGYLASSPSFSPDFSTLSITLEQRNYRGHVYCKIGAHFLRRWQNLQALLCHHIALDMDALAHLSRLPALTQLNFVLNETMPVSDSPLLFSGLRIMELRCKSLAVAQSFLSQARLPAVVCFTTVVLQCPSQNHLSSFLTNIETSGASHTIQQMWLRDMFDDSDPGTNPLVLDLDSLRPSMALSNLRSIHLDMLEDVVLSDNDLLLLASSWPHLEQFWINQSRGWNTSGGITPNGLVQLLQTCPSLSRIALAMDTHGYTGFRQSSEGFRLRILAHTIEIDVLDSVIEVDAVPAMAAFFASIVPRSNLSFNHWDCGSTNRDRKVYRRRWDDVFRRVEDTTNQRSLEL